MSWWEVVLLVYFIPFPFPQIMTWAAIMVALQDLKTRREARQRS